MRQHMKVCDVRGSFVCMGRVLLCCPEGTSENSPAFQRWVGRQKVVSPEGTAEAQSHIPSCSRPFGTDVPCGMFPGVKTPGYSQDVPPGQRNVAVAFSPSKQATRFISNAFKCISRPRCPAMKMWDTSIQGRGSILRAFSAYRDAAISEPALEELDNSAGCSLSLREGQGEGEHALACQWPEGTSIVPKTLCRVTTS